MSDLDKQACDAVGWAVSRPVSSRPRYSHALCQAALEKWGVWPFAWRVPSMGYAAAMQRAESRIGVVPKDLPDGVGLAIPYADGSNAYATDPLTAIARAVVAYAETQEVAGE